MKSRSVHIAEVVGARYKQCPLCGYDNGYDLFESSLPISLFQEKDSPALKTERGIMKLAVIRCDRCCNLTFISIDPLRDQAE
jgi:hypothetical protein